LLLTPSTQQHTTDDAGMSIVHHAAVSARLQLWNQVVVIAWEYEVDLQYG
jgi:hypothetical protein